MASPHFDVFLSCEGETTELRRFRDSIHSDLERRGLSVFVYEAEAGSTDGESIWQAIKSSVVCVLIVSVSSVKSWWCVRQVEAMIACNKVVVPVFYDVQPLAVRLQVGVLAHIFKEWELRVEEEMLQKWREALTRVAETSGFDLQNVFDGYRTSEFAVSSSFLSLLLHCCVLQSILFENLLSNDLSSTRNEAQLIHVLASRVLYLLNPDPMPAVMESQIADVMKLLNTEANDVRVVKIQGNEGVGKTPLAKALYHKNFMNFAASCFINVRQVSDQPNGKVRLRIELARQLLDADIQDNDVYKSTRLMKKLCSMRVFIVLDDVDGEEQLSALAGKRDWFGGGSRIIVTTQNLDLLKECEVYEHETYQLHPVSNGESLTEFSVINQIN